MENQDKLDLDTVVTRADALMHRRRQTILADSLEPPILTEVVPADVAALDPGMPLLTGIDPSPAVRMAQETSAQPLPSPAATEILVEELSRQLKKRLAGIVPALVESALDNAIKGIVTEIHQGLADSLEAAIDEILAEQGSSKAAPTLQNKTAMNVAVVRQKR